jgi:hypothetical protein
MSKIDKTAAFTKEAAVIIAKIENAKTVAEKKVAREELAKFLSRK